MLNYKRCRFDGIYRLPKWEREPPEYRMVDLYLQRGFSPFSMMVSDASVRGKQRAFLAKCAEAWQCEMGWLLVTGAAGSSG